jgi:hypothetical protein
MIRAKYSHAIANAKKARKREEAEARQAVRDQRSTTDQIARLNSGGHLAIKERKRLGRLQA